MHFASETRKYAKLAGGEPVSKPAPTSLHRHFIGTLSAIYRR
jgi:hypothetical protein